jgi:hypothetical protein
MLRSFSDDKNSKFILRHTVSYCISIKRIHVKTIWRKINWSALPIRLDSVETDVYKTRLFLFEIVLLLYETQNEQNPITNIAVPKKNRHVYIYNPSRSLLQIQWHKVCSWIPCPKYPLCPWAMASSLRAPVSERRLMDHVLEDLPYFDRRTTRSSTWI